MHFIVNSGEQMMGNLNFKISDIEGYVIRKKWRSFVFILTLRLQNYLEPMEIVSPFFTKCTINFISLITLNHI